MQHTGLLSVSHAIYSMISGAISGAISGTASSTVSPMPISRRLAMLAAWFLLIVTAPLTALELQGELKQGHIIFGQLQAGETVALDGEHLPVTASGRFVIGLGRDAPPLQRLSVSNGTDTAVFEIGISTRDYPRQMIEGIAKRIMTPNKEDISRSQREAQAVAAARKGISAGEDFLEAFTWPLAGPITGVYGSQRVYNGVPGRPHYGVDIAAPTGSPVKAPAGGVVRFAEADLFYSGGTLIIDHGHGLSSSFLHLSRVLVAAGERVEQGQLIAEVGATGRATGAHLDWRMNWRAQRVDPQSLLPDGPAR